MRFEEETLYNSKQDEARPSIHLKSISTNQANVNLPVWSG